MKSADADIKFDPYGSKGKRVAHETIRFADVVAFLEAKVPNSLCPSCSADSWTLQHVRLESTPDVIYGAFTLAVGLPFDVQGADMVKKTNVQTLPFGRPILPLICNSCGYIKSYDYVTVWQWAQGRKKPDDESAAESAGG